MQTAALPTRKLLIVEPDELTAWSLKSYFQKDYDILQVRSAAEAADQMKCWHPDAAMVSDNLPDVQIEDVEHEILTDNPDALIIEMTTIGEHSETHLANRVTVEKPFELAELRKILKAHHL